MEEERELREAREREEAAARRRNREVTAAQSKADAARTEAERIAEVKAATEARYDTRGVDFVFSVTILADRFQVCLCILCHFR